jgi:hypothetical protein
MTHTFKITADLARRVNQGIAEAQRNIDREMRYSEEFRNQESIKSNQAHIEKMVKALESGFLVVGE